MNRSTRIKACVLSVVFTAVLLLTPFSPVKADSFPTYFNVNDNNFYSAANIYVAYMELDQDQQDIANYLLGMYNLMYLGSRGFAFEQGAYQDQSSFIAKIKTFGYRLFYNASGIALQSRMDDFFLKYASAVLLYASQCNVAFSTWFSNLDEDFVIPVDQGILNSFTLLYNDNSDLGIANYGDVVSPWDSGEYLGYAFDGIQWRYNSEASTYNSFVNTGDILYSTTAFSTQYVIKPNTYTYPNALFIQRSSNYNNFRWGFSDENGMRVVNSTMTYSYLNYYLSGGYVRCDFPSSRSYDYRSITSSFVSSDLSDFIDFIFDNYDPTGLVVTSSGSSSKISFNRAYPYIYHVILVDNLNSLTNPEEVYNTESFDIIGLNGNMITPIDTVNLKPKVLTTINLPDNTQSSVSIRDMINDDNVVDDQDQPTDPWQINVVVQPNDTNPISVDVNMFSSGSVYLDYLWEHTRKVVVFAKDVLDCFEFEDSGGDSYGPKFAIYGVLVLGVAGGMIAKFLL